MSGAGCSVAIRIERNIGVGEAGTKSSDPVHLVVDKRVQSDDKFGCRGLDPGNSIFVRRPDILFNFTTSTMAYARAIVSKNSISQLTVNVLERVIDFTLFVLPAA